MKQPALGSVRLTDLRPHMVQGFINGLEGLSAASVRLAYKVFLHAALERAVRLDYLPRNPTINCTLPKPEQKEITPLTDEQAAALMKAAADTEMEPFIAVALFTGLRLSELLGLTWDNVGEKTLTINKQLAWLDLRQRGIFGSPKNGKARTLTPAPSVFAALKRQRRRQKETQIKAGPLWSNPNNLVFTTEVGGFIEQRWIEKDFKRLLNAAGISGFRFHDLRHTYAVNAIRAGDDIKTI